MSTYLSPTVIRLSGVRHLVLFLDISIDHSHLRNNLDDNNSLTRCSLTLTSLQATTGLRGASVLFLPLFR
jgi:hypothetical protein